MRSGLLVLATGFLGQWKEWLLKLQGSSASMWGKYPKENPFLSQVLLLRAPGLLSAGRPPPEPRDLGSQGDPQGRTRTATSGNLFKYKQLEWPEATKPDFN